jgi:hypothetical protein
MAIVASDIVKRLSVTTGSAGDSTAGTPAGALGKYVSTTAVTDATPGNVFDDVSGAEAAAGSTEYRCIFILNNHASLTLYAATIAVQSETAGGGTVTIALDNIAASAKGSAGAQAAQIAGETSTPSGVGAFGSGPLTIGDLAPGQVRGIWLRRVVTAGASALNPDGVVLRVSGDTLP